MTTSYSQSKQDLFCIKCNDGPGTFIDIGCSIWSWQSNCRLLLENGWKGIGIENIPNREVVRE